MSGDPNDAALAALRAVAISSTPVAAMLIKERNWAGAEVIVLNGDFNIKVTKKSPLGGSIEYDFEGTPSRDYGRTVAYA
jgi:hypothetical protein